MTTWKIRSPKKDVFGDLIPIMEYRRAISKISRDLHIPENSVEIVISADCVLYSGWCTPDGLAVVFNDCLEGTEIIRTVAHELRHVWQIRNNVYPGEIRKSNFAFDDTEFDEYENLASEIDARKYAEKMVSHG